MFKLFSAGWAADVSGRDEPHHGGGRSPPPPAIAAIAFLSRGSLKLRLRLFTALNLLPAIATSSLPNNSSFLHTTVNSRDTPLSAARLSLRKSAIVLKSGTSCQPPHLDNNLGFTLQHARRTHAVYGNARKHSPRDCTRCVQLQTDIHRSVVCILIGFALCFLLFACGVNRQAGNEDELIIGVRADDYVVEPLKSKLGMYPLNVQICEPLVRITPDYGIEPLLATRWERHGNTWRFFLRPNVVFSNGQPLRSEAVKYTFARLVKGDRAGIYQHTYLGENSVSVVDELTVDITPERPNQHLLEQIGHANYSIIAPDTEPAALPVGTGPFKLVEYRRGEWLKTERNELYWGEGPGLQRLTFRFLPDDTTRVLALQAGEAGMILDVPREQAATLRAQAGTYVIEAPVGRVAAIFLNTHGKAPYDLLANRNLRRAIGSSIDRRTLIEKVWEGNGELIATIGPRAMLGDYAGLVQGFVFDKEQATHLLAQEGWLPGTDGVRVRNGRRLTLTMIAWPEFDTATLEFIQAQLATIGIELRIVRSPDSASYQARIEAGEFDLDLEAPNQNDGNPMFLPALRFYSKSSGKTVRHFAPGGRFDAIIEAGLETDQRNETMRRSAEAQRLLVDEEAITIPLAGLKRIYAMRVDLRGFTPHPSLLNQRWHTITIQR